MSLSSIPPERALYSRCIRSSISSATRGASAPCFPTIHATMNQISGSMTTCYAPMFDASCTDQHAVSYLVQLKAHEPQKSPCHHSTNIHAWFTNAFLSCHCWVQFRQSFGDL